MSIEIFFISKKSSAMFNNFSPFGRCFIRKKSLICLLSIYRTSSRSFFLYWRTLRRFLFVEDLVQVLRKLRSSAYFPLDDVPSTEYNWDVCGWSSINTRPSAVFLFIKKNLLQIILPKKTLRRPFMQKRKKKHFGRILFIEHLLIEVFLRVHQ